MKSMQHITFKRGDLTHPRPYSCLLIVQAEDLDLALLPEDGNIGLALQLDPLRLPSPDLLHQLVTGDRPFSLLLPPSPHPSLTEYIILLLCSRNYITQEGTPLLVFDSPPSTAFRISLESQGWHTINSLVPDPRRTLTSPDQIADRADRLIFQAYTTTEDFFFIGGKDFLDTLSLEQSLDQYCRTVFFDHPLQETWILQRRELQKRVDRLSNKNKVTQERLRNAEHTIDIIRTKYKEDYDILFNWYQQEYEALPRWYKQFGQLLKVLMGRRSLKSLLHSIRRRTHRVYRPLPSSKKQVS
jgi:hypothetical protein